MTSTSLLCLYLLDEHEEAYDVLRFCSEHCAMVGRSNLGAQPAAPGFDEDAIEGTVCDHCGKVLV